jgi:hypothetical protein
MQKPGSISGGFEGAPAQVTSKKPQQRRKRGFQGLSIMGSFKTENGRGAKEVSPHRIPGGKNFLLPDSPPKVKPCPGFVISQFKHPRANLGTGTAADAGIPIDERCLHQAPPRSPVGLSFFYTGDQKLAS